MLPWEGVDCIYVSTSYARCSKTMHEAGIENKTACCFPYSCSQRGNSYTICSCSELLPNIY